MMRRSRSIASLRSSAYRGSGSLATSLRTCLTWYEYSLTWRSNAMSVHPWRSAMSSSLPCSSSSHWLSHRKGLAPYRWMFAAVFWSLSGE
jgi:hypothetical protein